MTLFVNQPFTSHSGLELAWKINADALTPDDWRCIAEVIASQIGFRDVIGVPRGGIPFAEALRPYANPASEITLICDDVATTGRSLTEMAEGIVGPVQGVVLFARGAVPPWVTAVFELNPMLR